MSRRGRPVHHPIRIPAANGRGDSRRRRRQSAQARASEQAAVGTTKKRQRVGSCVCTRSGATCAMHLTKPPAEEETAGGTTSREKRPRRTCTGKAQKPKPAYMSCNASGAVEVRRRSMQGARRAEQIATTGPRRPAKRRSERAPAARLPPKPPASRRKRQRATCLGGCVEGGRVMRVWPTRNGRACVVWVLSLSLVRFVLAVRACMCTSCNDRPFCSVRYTEDQSDRYDRTNETEK